MSLRGLVSAMMVAGLAQMTPAFAQVQEQSQDMGPPPALQAAAPAAPAPVRSPAEAPRVAQVTEDGFRAPAPAPAAVAPAAPQVQAAPPVQVAAQEVDPADKDLADAPGEEARPVTIDPATGKPMASPVRAVRKVIHVVPQPKLAGEVTPPAAVEAAKVAPVAVAVAAPVAAPVPVPAEAPQVVAVAAPVSPPERVAAAPVQVASADEREAASVEEEEHGDEANHFGQRSYVPQPAYAVEEHGDEANHVGRPATDPAAYADAVKAAIPSALNADRGAARGDAYQDRAPAPVYTQQERAPAPAYVSAPPVYAPAPPVYPSTPPVYAPARPVYAPAPRPVPTYAQDDRDAPQAYAQDDREAPRGYDDRYAEPAPRYAMQDRDVRPMLGPEPRSAWQEGSRTADRACDGARAGLLQQRLMREARQGVIDPRAAQDIDAELGNVDELRRSYCASGMTAWREDRLEQQFAQVEDRIRYEERDDRGYR